MAHVPFRGFPQETLDFLADLAVNNNRTWFEANRKRYEKQLIEPALSFLRALRPRLLAISPNYPVIVKSSGGSLLRIYRDMRFSKTTEPYKSNVAFRVRHKLGTSVASPGFFLSFDPAGLFLGVGCWRPDNSTLRKIRRAIDEHSQAWREVLDDPIFRRQYLLGGRSLIRAPKGHSPEHPFIEDLKRKDYVGYCEGPAEAALKPSFAGDVGRIFSAAAPFMRFLCNALDVPF